LAATNSTRIALDTGCTGRKIVIALAESFGKNVLYAFTKGGPYRAEPDTDYEIKH
jgi:hypothetical protein